MKELIFLIIKEFYGPEFAEICSIIHDRGSLDLLSLISETKQSFTSLKEILLVLIKHKVLDFSIPNPDNLAEPKGNAEYKLNIPIIINTLRYPVFLEIIGKVFSQNDRESLISRNIIEQFFLETSLSISEIIEGIDESVEGKIEEDEIITVVIALIRGNFICRAMAQGSNLGLFGKREEEKEEKKEINAKRKRKTKEKMIEIKGKRIKNRNY